MKPEKIIELVRGETGKYRATPASIKLLHSEKDERLFFKKLSAKDGRSLQQLRYYWSQILPTYCNHIDGMEKLVIETNGKYSYDIVHRWLTLQWVSETKRDDLVQTIPSINQKTHKIIWSAIVSIAFDKTSHKDMNAYLEWLGVKFVEKTKVSLEDAIKEDRMVT